MTEGIPLDQKRAESYTDLAAVALKTRTRSREARTMHHENE
jgi:hypothetical protein